MFFHTAECAFAVFPAGRSQSMDLSAMDPGWTTVFAGEAICSPVSTSYGFVVLVGRNMIAACTTQGKILWQKYLPGTPKPFLTVTPDDFIYVVTDTHKLCLFNPGGLLLWTTEVPFEIAEAPLPGNDGRIFLHSSDKVACYGMNGICKWLMTTDCLSNRPACVLNDGSLLFFLEKTAGGSTAGLRISPFGNVLEQISLGGIVCAAGTCTTGVLVALADGTAVMYAADSQTQNSLIILWSVSPVLQTGFKPLLIRSESDLSCIIYTGKSGTSIAVVKNSNGAVVSGFTAGDINAGNLVYFSASSGGLMLSDTKNAAEYSLADSSISWHASLPERNTGERAWNYLYYTQQGTLILCGTSWAFSGYRMIQRPENAFQDKKSDLYCCYYRSPDVVPDYLQNYIRSDPALQKDILAGYYGNREIEWVYELQTAIDSYIDFRQQKISNVREEMELFDSEKLFYENIMNQTAYFGTNVFAGRIARLLSVEADPVFLVMLVHTISAYTYDPDGLILTSLSAVLMKANPSEHELLYGICDSVYAICRFMGRPAFYRKGKVMLSRLLFQVYDNKTIAYARNTLSKINALYISD
jgi:hypothetical protein